METIYLLTEGEGPRKTCFKCHETLPLSQFYEHPMMKDGHLGKCKRCTRTDVRENYRVRRDQYIVYEQGRYGPERIAGIVASKKRHPEHHRARVHLHNAVSRGKIQKEPCEVCGDPKSEAHHDDYSKPLEVRWLCRKHHAELSRID